MISKLLCRKETKLLNVIFPHETLQIREVEF